MNRRRLLQTFLASAGLVGLPFSACWAIGEGAKFRIARFSPQGRRVARPGALRRLLREVQKRTSIDVGLDPVEIKLQPRALHQQPFLYLGGDAGFLRLSPKQIMVLRRYLTFGGFLLIDSAEGRLGGEFDTSVRQLVADLFPRPHKGFEPVHKEHVIYRSFYLLDRPAGRLLLAPDLDAVFHDERAMIVYCQNDLAGAWQRDDLGNFVHECYPGGERQRELAFRLGINLVMYALCLDYKTDQVHIPFILKRRKTRFEDL